MKRMSRVSSLLLVLLLIASFAVTPAIATATDADDPRNELGSFPILKETVALNIGLQQNANVEDYATNKYTKLMEDKVNVDLSFTMLPADFSDASQKLAIMVAGGSTLPDVVIMNLSDSDVIQYGAQGTFLPLNDYFDQYSYYIGMALANNNDTTTLPMLTMPDGNIYTVPYMNCVFSNDFSFMGWINQTWLDALGLSMPTTTEEYYEVLKAFKTEDPNGNGKADEIPLVGNANINNNANPFSFLMNAFIYTAPGSNYLTLTDGIIDAAYTKEAWLEGLKYMNLLVSEGLLSPLTFTQDQAQLKAMLDNEEIAIVGSFPATSWSIYQANSVRKQDIVSLQPLTGPEGVSYATYTPAQPGHRYFVTKDCANPDAAFILGDYMLSEEASVWARFGEPDVDYKVAEQTSGVSRAVNPDVKLVVEAILVWGSVQNAHWNDSSPKYRAYDSTDVAFTGDIYDQSYVKANALSAYQAKAPEEYIGKILYTAEEQEQLVDIVSTLKSFVEETAVRLITGNESFDFWDSYLKELDNIGLQTYIDITQTAYDRMYK